MDRMIRNLDPKAYRRLKARAALEGRPIGAVLSDAILQYLAEFEMPKRRKGKRKGLSDLPVFDFGPGSEHLSEHLDDFLYGGKP